MNQFTVTGTKQPRRPDLVFFINGLPLAVIELKNPADEQADIWEAYNQLQTYKDEIADLFVFNEALVISDGWTRASARSRPTASAVCPGARLPTRTTGRCCSSSWRRWCAASSRPTCSWTTCATSSCSSRTATR